MVEESVLKTDNRILNSITGSSPVPSVYCKKCDAIFDSQHNLANHIRWHHAEKDTRVECPLCHKIMERCGFPLHKRYCTGKRYCLQCGKELLGKTKKAFCSHVCSAKYSNKRRILKIRTKKVICKKCNNQFDINNHAPTIGNVCPSCKIYRGNKKASIRNLVAIKKNSFCLNCGKELPKVRKFCSQLCCNEFNKKIRIKYTEEKNGYGVPARRLKEYFLTKRGHVCSICGFSEWRKKPIPLILDHINGRAFDNRLNNLRLVCGNCDMQLPTYKSKNKNSDRKIIRKRQMKKYAKKIWEA